MSGPTSDSADGLPNLCGSEAMAERASGETAAGGPAVKSSARPRASNVRNAFATALHMHQPLIPAGGGDLQSAAIVGNLQYMFEHPGEKDAHNAPVFLDCYRRMGEFIPQLVAEGCRPRVMLDYSGCLLHGLRQMGAGDVIEHLRPLARDAAYVPCVEWLGTAWGHAVAPSTPAQDFRLHVRAWRHHFAAEFGPEALGRVRGFSPPEMALPNHPDVCYEFVRTLLDCGYRWVLVQEHTVEWLEDGGPLRQPHLPHRLVARNSRGEELSIVALVKTQGSDTKLVGQMQPYYEAKGLVPAELGGRSVPQLVTQIADGENGGVMMNEFPPMFLRVMRESAGAGAASETVPMNGTEYLDHLFATGVRVEDFPAVRPLYQKRVWDQLNAGGATLDEVIAQLRSEDGRFHMEGGSWTGDVSWVRGYESVLGPMEAASALFAEKVLGAGVPASDPRYRKAFFHLLTAQTSCFRYWGEGTWTDYGRELCRRAVEAVEREFA
jgi:hypothetical protein